MRRIVQGGLALLVLLGGLVFTTGTAQACSCAIGTPEERLDWADAVFSGQIVERTGKRVEKVGKNLFTGGKFTYTVEVDAVYKGQVAAIEKVVAGTDSASCGVTFPDSGPILVYGTTGGGIIGGSVGPGAYGTSLCSGSAATAVVPAVYGAGQPPIGAEPTPSPTQTLAPEPTQPAVDLGTSTGSTWAVMFGIALAVVLVVFVVVSLMQRRRRRPGAPTARIE